MARPGMRNAVVLQGFVTSYLCDVDVEHEQHANLLRAAAWETVAKAACSDEDAVMATPPTPVTLLVTGDYSIAAQPLVLKSRDGAGVFASGKLRVSVVQDAAAPERKAEFGSAVLVQSWLSARAEPPNGWQDPHAWLHAVKPSQHTAVRKNLRALGSVEVPVFMNDVGGLREAMRGGQWPPSPLPLSVFQARNKARGATAEAPPPLRESDCVGGLEVPVVWVQPLAGKVYPVRRAHSYRVRPAAATGDGAAPLERACAALALSALGPQWRAVLLPPALPLRSGLPLTSPEGPLLQYVAYVRVGADGLEPEPQPQPPACQHVQQPNTPERPAARWQEGSHEEADEPKSPTDQQGRAGRGSQQQQSSQQQQPLQQASPPEPSAAAAAAAPATPPRVRQAQGQTASPAATPDTPYRSEAPPPLPRTRAAAAALASAPASAAPTGSRSFASAATTAAAARTRAVLASGPADGAVDAALLLALGDGAEASGAKSGAEDDGATPDTGDTNTGTNTDDDDDDDDDSVGEVDGGQPAGPGDTVGVLARDEVNAQQLEEGLEEVERRAAAAVAADSSRAAAVAAALTLADCRQAALAAKDNGGGNGAAGGGAEDGNADCGSDDAAAENEEEEEVAEEDEEEEEAAEEEEQASSPALRSVQNLGSGDPPADSAAAGPDPDAAAAAAAAAAVADAHGGWLGLVPGTVEVLELLQQQQLQQHSGRQRLQPRDQAEVESPKGGAAAAGAAADTGRGKPGSKAQQLADQQPHVGAAAAAAAAAETDGLVVMVPINIVTYNIHSIKLRRAAAPAAVPAAELQAAPAAPAQGKQQPAKAKGRAKGKPKAAAKAAAAGSGDVDGPSGSGGDDPEEAGGSDTDMFEMERVLDLVMGASGWALQGAKATSAGQLDVICLQVWAGGLAAVVAVRKWLPCMLGTGLMGTAVLFTASFQYRAEPPQH